MRYALHTLTMILAAATYISCAPRLHAQCGSKEAAVDGLAKRSLTLTNDDSRQLDVNSLVWWLWNNGRSSRDPDTHGSGLRWRAPEPISIVYEDGPIWSTEAGNEIHAGGALFRGGLQAGNIVRDSTQPDPTPADPADPRHRIYRVRQLDRQEFETLSAGAQDSLRMDFNGWPADLGAPFVDNDGNGNYDPDFETWLDAPRNSDHPFFPGEQVLWFVGNDLDTLRTQQTLGSRPLGLEVQVFAWAGTGGTMREHTVFVEYTIVNLGSDILEDFRLGRWSDPDLGFAVDDLVGVDTTLNLQYVYNGSGQDEIMPVPPPAFGYVWLQTPQTAERGTTADFGFGTMADARNVPLASLSFYVCADPVYRCPDLGSSHSALQVSRNLHGLLDDGSPMIDPTTGSSTAMALAGDPVTRTGWIDGIIHPPHDCQFMSGTAGVRLAMEDTLKFIQALTVVQGGNHLLSVHALREQTRQLHDYYRYLRCTGAAPAFTHAVRYPDAGSWEVAVTCGPFPAGSASAVMRETSGAEVARVNLFDDGQHGDGTAGDGIFGGTLRGNRVPAAGTLSVEYDDGTHIQSWHVASDIPLSGDVHCRVHAILSDNLNYDGIVNPGEHVRLQIRHENRTTAAISSWHIFPVHEAVPLVGQSSQHFALTVSAGDDGIPFYDSDSLETYLAVQVPDDHVPGTPLLLPLAVLVPGRGLWYDTLRVDVEDFGVPVREGRLEHVAGNAAGTFDWRAADNATLKNARYRVLVDGERYEEVTLRVVNESEGTTVADGIRFPDVFGHDAPAHDGWKILAGSAYSAVLTDENGKRVDRPRALRWEWGNPERAWFEPYAQNIFYGMDFFGSSLTVYDLHPVRLVFDRVSTQRAYRWLRGTPPNYAFQDYVDVPLRAYDISDSTAPRQVTLGFVENMGSAAEDGRWMPTGSAADREYLLVFADDYHVQPRAEYQQPLLDIVDFLPCSYGLWAVRDVTRPMFEDGDTFTFRPQVPVSSADEYVLDFDSSDVFTSRAVTTHYALHQSYPNPATASDGAAVILFDTPRDGAVRLELYDLLGRGIRTLTNRQLVAGRHSVRVDLGELAAGTYVYAMSAPGVRLTRMMQIVR